MEIVCAVALFAVMSRLPGAQARPALVSMGSALPVNEFTLSTDSFVDLSYKVNNDMVYWPTINKSHYYSSHIISEGVDDGIFVREKWFHTAEHGGTHMDAPSHFCEKGNDISKMKADQLAGPLVILNVSVQVEKDPDYQVGLDDVQTWENKYGTIPEGAFVFMHSNWDRKRYPNRSQVFGSDNWWDMTTLHFPSFHPDTTKLLVEERNIRGVGVDVPSVDYGQSKDFGTHIMLCKHNLVAIEHVANLHNMPEAGGFVVALPIKLDGGSGGPLRLLGIRPQEEAPPAGSKLNRKSDALDAVTITPSD